MPSLTARFRLLISIPLLLALGACSAPQEHTSIDYSKASYSYPATALDQYVAEADPSYRWHIAKTVTLEDIRVEFVQLTSQTWQPPAPVDNPEWQHWMIINTPAQLTSDTALLYISGGKSAEPIRKAPNQTLARIALRSGAITVELRAIPNQYLVFDNDGQRRKEDDLIAYTWARYLENGDPIWPAQLPMVKSVVRAMDTLQALHGIDKFVLAGASKRGWTTWLTGAVDNRVKAMIPIVIDVLNVETSMNHHHAAYGYWSPAINDYVQHGIMENRHSANFDRLMALVDPYRYRERLNQPKFLINAAGDEFFLPDSSQFYFDQLPGEKYLRYVPNANHSLKHSNAYESLEAYFSAFITQQARPRFSWDIADGVIHLTAKDRPTTVKFWQANNSEARDFRLDSIGQSWRATTLSPQDDGTSYIGKIDSPVSGWAAAFIELTYDTPGRFPLTFTTQVSVVPDNLPFSRQMADTSSE